MALMALLALLVVAVLGSAAARMHLRGADIAAEFVDGGMARVAGDLAELGFRHGRRQLRDSGCVLPGPAVQTLDVTGFGTLTLAFVDNGSGEFRIAATGDDGAKQETLACDLLCSPPTTCPEGSDPECVAADAAITQVACP